jgi:anti-sigma B factor antagonist
MTITETKSDENVILQVAGRLDTTTAPQLESKLKECTKNAKILALDLSNVEYISSAGLRVVLLAHKLMAGVGGKMSIAHPSDFCKQVFAATGMDGVLSIID